MMVHEADCVLEIFGSSWEFFTDDQSMCLFHSRESNSFGLVTSCLDLGLGFAQTLASRWQVDQGFAEHSCGCGERANVARFQNWAILR
jgi:hypothetical protein